MGLCMAASERVVSFAGKQPIKKVVQRSCHGEGRRKTFGEGRGLAVKFHAVHKLDGYGIAVFFRKGRRRSSFVFIAVMF